MRAVWRACVMACLLAAAAPSAGAESAETEVARAAVESAGRFFAEQAAVKGGYVWAYTPDLSVRRGEGGRVEEGVIWIQSPGTPAVGGAFLRLFEATGDKRWLEAAGAVADALVSGQLASGGWFNFTETLPEARSKWCYRSEGVVGEACSDIQDNERRNRSVLDDNITQSALGFLLWYSEAVEGDADAAEAVTYGLDRLVVAQYPNGAWPVMLDRVFPHRRFAAAWAARLPESWSRSWVKPEDPPYFVMNDDLVRDVVRLLLAAERRLERKDLLPAARRSGEFLLASQLPWPNRGWAQTYNDDLEPVWGRRFEPPAVASRETAGSIEALLMLNMRTGERRYLEGAMEAAAWLRASRLPSGDWARFYELETNRPLYVREDGALTYEQGDDLVEGYTFIGKFGIEAVLDLADRVAEGEKIDLIGGWDWVFGPIPAQGDALKTTIESVDEAGRVVEDEWIRSATFIQSAREFARLVGEGAR